ncbi:hypothetical protein BGZ94_007077 [Podila epigama]|nr:hypothetical protein BGZ94_007077 [Podila epigama]
MQSNDNGNSQSTNINNGNVNTPATDGSRPENNLPHEEPRVQPVEMQEATPQPATTVPQDVQQGAQEQPTTVYPTNSPVTTTTLPPQPSIEQPSQPAQPPATATQPSIEHSSQTVQPHATTSPQPQRSTEQSSQTTQAPVVATQLDVPQPQPNTELPSQTAQSSTTAIQPEQPLPPSRPFWCHQCRAEITPMMVPDPMCPNCHSEFVEEIVPENDPRTFIGAAQSTSELEEEAAHEPINLEDLFRLFQAAFTAPQQLAAQRQHAPAHTFTTGTQYTLSSSPSGTTITRHIVSPVGGGAHNPNQNQGLGPEWRSPPSFLAGLLNRFGIEVHYSTDPNALGALGGPGPGAMFPIVGNPGDYVFGQRGLDDIISQMMELQNRQHGPVGATEDVINNIPKHELTDAELEAKAECAVCKDEFTKEDHLLQLPCKHIFHEDCIKPWLKVSGTCPTCRFSLVRGYNDGNHDSQDHGSSRNATNSGNTSTALPGAFPTPSNTGTSGNSLPHPEPLD